MAFLQLVVWLLFCVVFVLTQTARPAVVLSAIVVLRLVVPSTAGGLLLGDWEGNAALHPATVLLLIHACFGLRGRTAIIRDELSSRKTWYTGLALVGFLFVVEAVVGSGAASLVGLTNAVLAPVLLCFVARVHDRAAPGLLRVLVLVFLATMVSVAAIVVLQTALRSGVPWGFRQSVPDPAAIGSFRPRGTFDSALDLGFAAAVAIPMTTVIRRTPVRLIVAVVLLGTVVLSASRAPTVVAVVGLTWLVVTTIRTFAAFATLVVCSTTAVLVALQTSVLDGLTQRLSGDDGNSFSARAVASRYVTDHVWDHLFAGGGWGAAWQLKGSVLRTSLENSYAILAFDLGLVPVIALVALQVAPALRRTGRPGTRLAVLAAVFFGFCYSGLVTMSAASTILWLVLAHVAPTGTGTSPEPEPEPEPGVAADPICASGCRPDRGTCTPLCPGTTAVFRVFGEHAMNGSRESAGVHGAGRDRRPRFEVPHDVPRTATGARP